MEFVPGGTGSGWQPDPRSLGGCDTEGCGVVGLIVAALSGAAGLAMAAVVTASAALGARTRDRGLGTPAWIVIGLMHVGWLVAVLALTRQ